MGRGHAAVLMTVTVTSSVAVARLRGVAQDRRDVSAPVDLGAMTKHCRLDCLVELLLLAAAQLAQADVESCAMQNPLICYVP
jgi:hypothetical protein